MTPPSVFVEAIWDNSLPSSTEEETREFTKEQICQLLAVAWDQGVSFGWHLDELRTDQNPYGKVGP